MVVLSSKTAKFNFDSLPALIKARIKTSEKLNKKPYCPYSKNTHALRLDLRIDQYFEN